MRLKTLFLATLACLGLLAANGCPPGTIQETKLLASDGAERDFFGASVSVSGDVAVVGASLDGDNEFNSGSAYVFRFDGTDWVEETKLIASDGEADDHFGYSASVSGDVAVLGACFLTGYSKNGSAYVFRFDGTDWVEEAKLLASDGEVWDDFGCSVSVSGDVAVVGAPDDGPSGSSYVYRFDGTTWVEEAKLLASDGAAGDYFGASVSVSDDVAVAGAGSDDDNGDYSGSAYVFRFDGTNWVEEAKLLPSDGAAEDGFGASVSVSGNVAVVGAVGDDDSGLWSGSAYVFRFDGTDWVEEAKLLASDGAFGQHFGQSVSVSGGVAVVSAAGDDDAGELTGAAYVYRFNGTSWVEKAKLLASDGAERDVFGTPVSVSGGVAVVGASGDEDYGRNSGSAYVFSPLSATPACADGRDNDGDTLADLDDPGCALAVDTSERSGLLVCDDGQDNDDDTFTDYPDDPGCREPAWSTENPGCQDGIDNDTDGLIDFDGGLSVFGYVATDPDPQCVGEPWRNNESACGLGWELGPVLASLMFLARRRGRGHRNRSSKSATVSP